MPDAGDNKTIAVIFNKRSGANDPTAVEHLTEAFRSHGIESTLLCCSDSGGADANTLTRQALAEGFTTIVAAGGDGTVSAVAAEMVESEAALGVIPLGTLNHFARDAGIPTDIDAAVATIAAGHVQQVDVGEVNGHVFVNNSSLGLYPHFARHRGNQRRLGRNRWSALVQALWAVMGRNPFVYVHVMTNDHDVVTRTPLVFIGNNEYEVQGLQAGTRASLTSGWLSLFMTRQVGVGGFLWLALRALFRNLKEPRDFISDNVREVMIEVQRPSVHVALDGEVVRMRPPLRYRIRPQVLRLLVPTTEVEKR
jgi:diacylglycerol kinase family enzyme